MKIRFNVRRMILAIIITGAYWYRLFIAGTGFIGKSNLYSLLVVMAFFIMLCIPNCNRKYVKSIRKGGILRSVQISYGIIVFYGIITLFWAMNKVAAVKGIESYFIAALAMIVLSVYIIDFEDVLFSCKVCLINVVITSALAIYEIITGQYIFGLTSATSVLQWIYANMHSPIVQYNHPNNLATALLMSLPFCEVALMRGKRKHRGLFLGLVATMTVIFVATNSRFALLILCLFFLLKIMHSKKYGWVTLTILFAVLGFLFLFTIVKTSDVGNVQIDAVTQEARPLIWENAFNNFLNSNGLGVGIGNAYYVNSITARVQYIGRPCHNYVLEVLEELGIIGFVTWMIWFLNLMRNAIIARKNDDNLLSVVCVDFLIIFIPMTIQQSSLLGSNSIWMLFGIVIGIIQYNMSLSSEDLTSQEV